MVSRLKFKPTYPCPRVHVKYLGAMVQEYSLNSMV